MIWEFIEIILESSMIYHWFAGIWFISDPVCLRTDSVSFWKLITKGEYKSDCLLIVIGLVKMVNWFFFPFCIDSMKCHPLITESYSSFLPKLLFCYALALFFFFFAARRKSSLLLNSPPLFRFQQNLFSFWNHYCLSCHFLLLPSTNSNLI